MDVVATLLTFCCLFSLFLALISILKQLDPMTRKTKKSSPAVHYDQFI